MRFLFSLPLAGVLLAGCSGGPVVKGTLVTHNDFESVLGWGGSTEASVTNERAHSGNYSLKVGPQNEYSYTYGQTLGRMSAARIKTLTVSAWVWVPNPQAPSSLVLSITHSPERDSPVFYGQVNLAQEAGQYKTWRRVTKSFALPDSVQATNQFKCYLWRVGSTENVYADDVTLSVEN